MNNSEPAGKCFEPSKCFSRVRPSARHQDLEFARMFATTVKPKPVPVPTFLLFTARDGMTVAASFNMPGPASKYLQERLGMPQKAADVTAQVFTAERGTNKRSSMLLPDYKR